MVARVIDAGRCLRAAGELGHGSAGSDRLREAGDVVDPDGEAPAWFRRALDDSPDLGCVRVRHCDICYRTWGPPQRPGVVLIHGGAAHAAW